MMKNIVCTAALAALLFGTAQAQTMTRNAGRTTFGIRAGVNFQNINGKIANGSKLNNDLLTAFHGGVNAEIPVGTGFYVQPGVLYSMKGTEWENSNIKTKLSYIDIPVNLVYKPILGTGNMVLGFGPYIGFGIGGKITDGTTSRKVENNNTYSATAVLYRYKKTDAGANLLAGYEFANNLSFQLNAQLGLVDINPKNPSDNQTSLRNTGWGLSLGYRF